MPKRLSILAVILSVVCLHRITAEPWLEYEPKVVTLVGKVILRTFPGPPNYESIKKGDKPETVLMLVLERPIHVQGKSSIPEGLYPTVKNIRQVQLWVKNPRSQVWLRLKKSIGKWVEVKGRLSHAVTGHHYAPVLMEVVSFKARYHKSRSPNNQQLTFTVHNNGKVAATFTLTLWVNGKRTDQRITLKPKTSRAVRLKVDQLPKSEAVYIRAVCDPEDEVPERNEADNVAEAILPPRGHGIKGMGQVGRVCAVAWNPTERTLRDVPVSIPLPPALSGAEDIVISDAKGNLLPSHVSTKLNSVTVLVKELKPYNAVTLWLSTTKGGRGSSRAKVPFAIHHAAKGAGYTIETPKLLLIKGEPDGDAFDRIILRDTGQGARDTGREGKAPAEPKFGLRDRTERDEGIELGSFTPLIWQVVAGQNLWVRPDRVERIEVVDVGPARLVVDITFVKGRGTGDEGRVITEVGAGGKFEPLRVEPQPFRCAYRFTFFADQPFFLSQCLWVENIGKQAWQWRGYYHYTLSRIGGNSADDEVGGPNVPNYWLQFASWRAPKLRLHYGVIPLKEDERLGLWFWKDEGGNQHPDCHRRLEGTLKPRERWQPKEPEPIVAVFGAFETDDNPRPWSDLIWWLRSWAKIGVKVF